MVYYVGGRVSDGAYFIYKGVRYGTYTKLKFKPEVYKRLDTFEYTCSLTLYEITNDNGTFVWHLGNHEIRNCHYPNIVPDRDIEQITVPVYYYEPKELVKLRIENGTWFRYIQKHTLIYTLCLLISPVFQEWYLIWTIGLYAYLRFCYITLSKGELYRGW